MGNRRAGGLSSTKIDMFPRLLVITILFAGWLVLGDCRDADDSECQEFNSRSCVVGSDCTSCRDVDPSGNWQCVVDRCINLNRTELDYAVLDIHEECPAEE